MKYTLMVVLFLILPLHSLISIACQEQNPPYPRDTSFTIASAAEKVKKSHPHAVAVTAQLPPGVTAEESVVYSTAAGRPLRLDLFRPANAGAPLPAVLVIHGGGWSSGDRSMEIPLAQRLATHGFVAAAVEYRLSPEAKYPAALRDLRTAIRWLRAHAGIYGIDTSKIAACGGSAGGNLAVSLGLGREGSPATDNSEWPGHSARVQAVVDIDGPLNLTIPEERVKADDPSKPSAARRWLGCSYEECPDLWLEVSPVYHVSAECPPIMFINSSIERFHAGRDEMIEEMNRFGIPSAVHTFPGTPHPFWLFHPWAEETSDRAARFLHGVFGTTK